MTRLQMTEALTERAVAASEMRLIGSFIAYGSRESGMYSQRQVLQLYPTDENRAIGALRDPMSIAIYNAAGYCYEVGISPTPEHMASAMMEQGYIDFSDMVQDYQSLVERLRYYASAGASSIREFQRIEALHAEKLQSEQAMKLPEVVAEIMAKLDGRTYEEKLTDIERHIKMIRGDWVGVSRTLTYENQKRHLTEMQERIRARVGNVYMTYCPHMGVISDRMYPQPGEMIVVSGPSGGGKAQPLSAKILTPDGWTTMGRIEIGDEVISGSGGKARVIAIHPQGEKDIYRVKFSDGTSTTCCEDHLWNVRYGNSGYRTWSLKKIVESGLYNPSGKPRHYVQRVKPVEFNSRELPLDPYLLGALLGDGSMKYHLAFTNADMDVVNQVASTLPNLTELRQSTPIGYRIINSFFERKSRYGVHKGASNMTRTQDNPVIESLREMGLWGKGSSDKFIPDAYLYADLESRVRLLQGLMDTDGSGKFNRPNVDYITTSIKLALGVQELVRSFGGKAEIVEKQPVCSLPDGNKVNGHIAYRLCITLPNEIKPFTLSRKLEKMSTRTKYAEMVHYIQSVEYVGKMEAQCITLDKQDGLYVTDDYIVTHNSIILHQNAEWWALCGFRVLDWLGEDGADIFMSRAIARWSKDTTYDEIMHGDPQDKQRQYTAIFDEAYERGGEVVYEEQQNLSGADLITMIEARLDRAISEGNPYSAVVVDYFQVINFQVDANAHFKGNIVAAASFYARRLREISQKYNIVMVVGSQETRDGDTVKTQWAAALVHCCQQWINFIRPIAKNDMIVYENMNTKQGEIGICRAGEELPYMFVSTPKTNRFKKVRNVPLLVLGAQQKIVSADFYRIIQQDPTKEFIVPVFREPDAAYYEKQQKTIYGLKLAAYQINPMELLEDKTKKTPRSNSGMDFPV